MGSSEFTEKLKLPVFADTDKPSWLGDHNDMVRKIEAGHAEVEASAQNSLNIATTAMRVANETQESAAGAISSATEAATTATEAAKTASDNASSALAAANNLADIATTAKRRADEAYTLANAKYQENSQAFHQYVQVGGLMEGFAYDFITISGDTPIPFRKIQANDNAQQVAASNLKNLHDIISDQHYSIAIGGDNARGAGNTTLDGASYVVPAGLQINNSKALQDFGVMGNGMTGGDQDALLVFSSGDLKTAYRADGVTAQKYVDDGAVMSITGGPICIEGGTARTIPNSQYSDYLGYTGGWTLIGKTRSNNWFFMLVYAREDEAGCTLSQAVTEAISQGADTAIVVATGTSVHCSWGSYIVHPSSQKTNKGDYTWYMLTVPRANEYDTGWLPVPGWRTTVTRRDSSPTTSPISIKQHNDTVYCSVNMNISKMTGRDWIPITNANPIPDRFRSSDNQESMTGIVNGFWGHPYTVLFGDENAVPTRSGMLKCTTWGDTETNENFKVYGSFSWISQYA